MQFEHFRATVESAGLIAVDHGDGHWQIRGGRKFVSYWDETSRGRVVYVQGEKRGKPGMTLVQAIAIAGKPHAPTGIESRIASLEAEVAELREALMELTLREFVG